jgi:hypothetical protein
MGLHETFSHIRRQILLNPLPTISKVFSKILQEERQREISYSIGSLSHDTATLMSKSTSIPQNRSVKQTASCKDHPTCSHCSIIGHTIEKCYKLHRYPPG